MMRSRTPVLKILASLLLLVLSLAGCQKKLAIVDSALIQNPRDPAVVDGQLENGFSYFLRLSLIHI